MLLSSVSVLDVAQSISEIPEELMNNSVYQKMHIYNKINLLLSTLSYMFRTYYAHFQGEFLRSVTK
jgi:hypothetical protein